jgi:hypothetical protein
VLEECRRRMEYQVRQKMAAVEKVAEERRMRMGRKVGGAFFCIR